MTRVVLHLHLPPVDGAREQVAVDLYEGARIEADDGTVSDVATIEPRVGEGPIWRVHVYLTSWTEVDRVGRRFVEAAGRNAEAQA